MDRLEYLDYLDRVDLSIRDFLKTCRKPQVDTEMRRVLLNLEEAKQLAQVDFIPMGA